MKACLLCGKPAVEELIDFGRHAVCNRFLETASEQESPIPLGVGVCHGCGVVQLLAPPAVDAIKPRVDWLTCNEPEGHLDDLAADIAALSDISPATASICGVSFKDDSLLDRLRKLGFTNTRRLDPRADLGIHDACAGIETVTAHLTPERVLASAKRTGPADVVIARHIFEHAADPRRFAAALVELMAPDGYLIIEIPDCSKALAVADYTTIWEEHSLYFTPMTFHRGMESLGFEIQTTACIPYTLENSLIAVMKRAHSPAAERHDVRGLAGEIDRARQFAAGFDRRRTDVVHHLETFRRHRGRIAIFGAGHLACTYINLFALEGLIDCVLDDNPRKVGLFMPGSRLPIKHSQTLADPGIAMCLLSVGAGGERAIIERHAAFVARGGLFRSIFPASGIALVQ